jgi:hypothetical protein
MSDSLPIEVTVFTAVLERMLEPSNTPVPTLNMISRFMQEIAGTSDVEAVQTFFGHLRIVDGLIAEHMVSVGSKRSGERLRARISKLFGGDNLGIPYNSFQPSQSHHIQSILDMLPMLDVVQFDNDGLEKRRDDIVNSIDSILSDISKSDELSHATKQVISAQVYGIRKTLERFEISGVVPFRDSIYCSIGRLTIELKDLDEKQAGKLRQVIDDIVRVKDLAEIAGGTLKLAGPFIAGYLSAPGAV